MPTTLKINSHHTALRFKKKYLVVLFQIVRSLISSAGETNRIAMAKHMSLAHISNRVLSLQAHQTNTMLVMRQALFGCNAERRAQLLSFQVALR